MATTMAEAKIPVSCDLPPVCDTIAVRGGLASTGKAPKRPATMLAQICPAGNPLWVRTLSLVPGGLGVFETIVTLMTATPSKAALLGAFLTYRMIYFIGPFAIAIVCFAVTEIGRQSAK